jgi:hypothetical protein
MRDGLLRLIEGEPPPHNYIVYTDGVRFGVIPIAVLEKGETLAPSWASLCWFLRDDPRGRPDWSGTNRMDFTKPNKMSKSD